MKLFDLYQGAKLQEEIVSHISSVEQLQRLQKEEAANHFKTQSK